MSRQYFFVNEDATVASSDQANDEFSDIYLEVGELALILGDPHASGAAVLTGTAEDLRDQLNRYLDLLK